MHKVLNIFFAILILIFFLNIYNYYSSSKNIKIKGFNRNNINKIISDKASNLPILANDTNNVIVFNDSFSEEINNDKLRSFWDLLKTE
jgi:hypothetical protein|tara:strand:- start:247 stop:510 length:264 start_codon:yes stop_codon:yes gene_type:complete